MDVEQNGERCIYKVTLVTFRGLAEFSGHVILYRTGYQHLFPFLFLYILSLFYFQVVAIVDNNRLRVDCRYLVLCQDLRTGAVVVMLRTYISTIRHAYSWQHVQLLNYGVQHCQLHCFTTKPEIRLTMHCKSIHRLMSLRVSKPCHARSHLTPDSHLMPFSSENIHLQDSPGPYVNRLDFTIVLTTG